MVNKLAFQIYYSTCMYVCIRVSSSILFCTQLMQKVSRVQVLTSGATVCIISKVLPAMKCFKTTAYIWESAIIQGRKMSEEII